MRENRRSRSRTGPYRRSYITSAEHFIAMANQHPRAILYLKAAFPDKKPVAAIIITTSIQWRPPRPVHHLLGFPSPGVHRWKVWSRFGGIFSLRLGW